VRAFFVTSTGTEIGKTFVTATLARHFTTKGHAVNVLKPVLTGFDTKDFSGSDPALLLKATGKQPTLAEIERVSPFRFKAPLAPNLAAEREGRRLDFNAVVKACTDAARARDALLLIEGIGGLMVPLDNERTVLDLIEALEFPAILVAGSYLGTISHTLTALEVAKTRKLDIAALVISESEGSTVSLGATAATLRKFTSIPVFSVPRDNHEGTVKVIAQLAERLCT
jgi:dethiobiotin synthetase